MLLYYLQPMAKTDSLPLIWRSDSLSSRMYSSPEERLFTDTGWEGAELCVQIGTAVCEQDTPLEKKAFGKSSFWSTKSGGG